MAYFFPNSGSSAFTGRNGTSYVTTAGAVDFPPSDIALASANGWVQSPIPGWPGNADVPQGSAFNPSNPVANLKVFQTGCPMVLAPTGSMANNGAITLGTALPAGFMGGSIYLYLPANAIVAGSAAGWYFTVMTSTTVGTVYNQVYTTGTPFVPTSPIPFVTTGPGAYTGATSAQTALSFVLPGGMMGYSGNADIYLLIGFHGSTNNKTVDITAGGTNIFALVEATAATLAYQAFVQWNNLGQANVQAAQVGGNTGALTTAQTYTAINTANAVTLTVTVQNATATDWISIDNFAMLVTPG